MPANNTNARSTWRRHQFSPRQLLVFVGALFWVGLMLVNTGYGGVVALWTNSIFLLEIIFLSSATRSVSIRQITSLFFLGGFTMGLSYVGAHFIPHTLGRAFLVPPMEEVLKLAPVLFVLWRGRHSATWTIGVTDVMLLAAASGAGFGMVEDAYIRHNSGWPAQLDWLPVTEITGGRLIAGHAIWTALAGITLGFALLLRSRPRVALGLGASGLGWSVLDHIANNFGVAEHGGFASFLNGITGRGWGTIYLFAFGLIAAVAFDGYIVHTVLPPLPELKLGLGDSVGRGRDGLLSAWNFLLTKRALAFVLFQYREGSASLRTQLENIIGDLAKTLDRLTVEKQTPLPQTQATKPSS